MSRPSRPLALLALVLFGGLTMLGACTDEQSSNQSSASANSVAEAQSSGTVPGENSFIPADENVSSCVGTLERPGCGSKDKGGWRMYLTFAVLIGGMSFIGWHVVKGIRARDAVVNRVEQADQVDPAEAGDRGDSNTFVG